MYILKIFSFINLLIYLLLLFFTATTTTATSPTTTTTNTTSTTTIIIITTTTCHLSFHQKEAKGQRWAANPHCHFPVHDVG